MIKKAIRNFSDPARQGSIYLNSAEAYIRVLGGMNSTAITNENLVAQLGNLRGLRVDGVTLPADGLYAPGLAIDACNVAGLSAMFSVLEGEISSKVSNGDFSSYVTQTAEEFEVVAKEIKLKADKTTIDGLLTVNGQIRADKIDTKDLRAAKYDGRLPANDTGTGGGLVMEGGAFAAFGYDQWDKVTFNLYLGKHDGGGYSGVTFFGSGCESSYSANGLYIKSNGVQKVEINDREMVVHKDVKVDMPGVLAKCRIGTEKTISKHWGRAIEKVVYLENQVANYRIIHNWEFNGYTTMATPYGIGGDGRGIIKVDVIDETSTYIDIRVSDSTNGYLIRGSFNLLIIGANG